MNMNMCALMVYWVCVGNCEAEPYQCILVMVSIESNFINFNIFPPFFKKNCARYIIRYTADFSSQCRLIY